MKRTPVLVLAVALLSVGCGSGAPSVTTSPGAASASAPTTSPTSSPTAELPNPPSAAATAAPSAAAKVDYMGDWGGKHLAGTVKWCGSTAHPYWAADMVSGSGDRGFMSYLIPEGSTEAIQGLMDTPFIVPEFNAAAAGTGQFVPGDPPHFIIVNQEGTYDITLKVGKFCNTQ